MKMKPIKYILYLICLLTVAPGQLLGQLQNEWPIFRGDPTLSGESRARIKTPLELQWVFQADDAFVAGPVISDDKVYVSSVTGTVYAISLAGQLVWKYETDNSIEAPALVLDGKVYIGNLSGKLYCLDAQTGVPIWIYEADNQIMGSANYFEFNNKKYIVVGSYDFFLHCIEAESGRGVWKYESDNFVNGAAAIGRGLAMFGGCDGYLHMVNVENGKSQAKLEVATYIAGSVTINGNLAFTGDYDGLFTCIDLDNNTIKWQYDNPSSGLPILGSPSVDDKRVIIGGQDKYVRCFEKENGREVWSFNAGGRIDASLVIVRDLLIAVPMDGMIYILNVENGSEIWSYEIGSAMAHNPAVINGHIVVSARDGGVYCFDK